jgi:hypothetical protein
MGILDNFLTDPSFRRSTNANGKQLYFGTRAGIKYGVALANEWHGNFALNKDTLETLLAALAAGKIDKALVVQTTGNANDGTRTAVGERDAAEVRAVLEHEPPREGRFGAYWVRTSFISDDDPF